MKRVMVRYKVKPERVSENEALIRAVYEELGQTEPAGLRYAAFKLEDGLTFVHIATVDTDGDRSPLLDVPAFQSFLAELRDRCDEAPVATAMDQIGSFRL